MDFARQIGKSDEFRIWKKSHVQFVTTTDNLLSEDTSFSEDNRLVNWRKWLVKRKRLNRQIEFVTGRSQTDQLQSSSEKFRAFVEMKNLMEHASKVVDKYRDGSEFWKMPEFLPSDAFLPEVSLTLTRKELNFPIDLLHVGLADSIAHERDLIKWEDPWERSEYLKIRKQELAKEIAFLLPKKPEMAMLVVQRQTFREEKLEPRIPPITVTEPDEEQEEQFYKCTYPATVLKIQTQEFVWQKSQIRTESTDFTWSLIFESKIHERAEKKIILENKGTCVIVYYWHNLSVQSTNMSLKRRSSPFFFNKMKNLILPGQTVKIKVWYLPRTRGVFTESWQLVTEPKLSSSAFLLRLWGSTIDLQNTGLTNSRTVNEYLNRCIRDSMIRSIIEEIMAGVKYIELLVPVYKTLFLQNELFSSLNPHYFYHPSIVMQLGEMYSRITNLTAPSWSLPLNKIRDIILQIEETNYKYNMLARFNDLCKQCLKPNFYSIARNNKSNAVYDVLCAFVNIFEDESQFVKNNLGLIREEPIITSKMNRQKLKLLSQRSIYSRETYSTKSINYSETAKLQKEEKISYLNLQLYREIFFIHIHKALEETIQRVCAIIDSHNKLNELYK